MRKEARVPLRLLVLGNQWTVPPYVWDTTGRNEKGSRVSLNILGLRFGSQQNRDVHKCSGIWTKDQERRLGCT